MFPILRAEPTTTSKKTKDKSFTQSLSGEQLTLVSGLQTRTNNRATINGSMKMCSDEFMLKTINENGQGSPLQNSANYDFCMQLIDWNFHESGVIRAVNLRHNKKGEKCKEENCQNPENYKIEDNVEFYIDIQQKTRGHWHPYISQEVPLQFIMLDPYYQVTLE